MLMISIFTFNFLFSVIAESTRRMMVVLHMSILCALIADFTAVVQMSFAAPCYCFNAEIYIVGYAWTYLYFLALLAFAIGL